PTLETITEETTELSSESIVEKTEEPTLETITEETTELSSESIVEKTEEPTKNQRRLGIRSLFKNQGQKKRKTESRREPEWMRIFT
ncbi:hypothetical protein JJE00_03655, partial [Candidatus Bathyarchaeota archaeon]|nr:hypothetical protein [Candidatus Bathyarchaeota archaeon]